MKIFTVLKKINHFNLLKIIILTNIMLSFFNLKSLQAKTLKPNETKIESVYDFYFTKTDNQKIFLKEFSNKVLLVVNTASKCGFTKQYEDLEKLYKKYKNKGLEIIAVPSSDFGNQEFASDEEIQKFCKLNYGVSFLVVKKEIITGDKSHPFYKFAKSELGFGTAPKWNFHKYLINHQGKLIDYFHSNISPLNEKFISKIEDELKKINNE